MEKIKICFGVTKGNWGGAQKYVYDLATNLPPEDFVVSVITGQPGTLCDKLSEKKIEVSRLVNLGRDIKLRDDIHAFFTLLSLFSHNRPDILHLNSPKMGLLGALAGRMAGVKKIIYTSHGWPFLEDRSKLSKIFFKMLCWKICLLSHRVIVISESEKIRTRNWWLVRHKINLIYNGVATTNLLSRKEARAELNLPEDAFVVGTIAELHKNKGLEYLPKIDNVDFVLIGEGEERKNLENKGLILAGNIPDASRLLPAFDIFVLPSIKEGLPYVILEAGLAGLPVIATSVGGIPEMIDHEQSGILVPTKNPEKIKRAIETLKNHPEICQSYGESLKKKVGSGFSLEGMVEETMIIYGK
ncbi:glycosyltransferase [Candidatus Nomurabacteria bacterium]|nr:glycosyltransferase [Candidatus Nomurabacteria bacterium]